MKVYVQLGRNKLPYSVNAYQALKGFEQLGFEIELFSKLSELDPTQLEQQDIFVGGIGTIRQRLRQLGIAYQEINYPKVVQEYLGRKIWYSHIDYVNTHPEMWPVFVKPVEGKKFTGKVIRTPKDLIGLGSSFENAAVICSEVVDIVAEWRVYVRYGEILGVKQYYGDWEQHLDPEVVKNCIAAYEAEAPAGYGIDFGVTKAGKTILIEINEGYSLAAYGLSDLSYAKLLAARWAEITGTVDECNF